MKRLVLVGAGHAHVQVLKDWAARPVAGVELVLVTPEPLAPYSGMVPGWLAGLYDFDEICIDVPPLAREAGAVLRLDRLVALDAERRRLTLAGGDTIEWDLLSLDVGSTLHPPTAPAASTVLGMRPLGTLQARWDDLLHSMQDRDDRRTIELVVAGGGAAGFESALATVARLRELRPGRAVRTRLYTAGASLLPNLAARARRLARDALHKAAIELVAGTALDDGAGGRRERGSDLAPVPGCDVLLWATGGRAHAWQASSGLAVDGGGFIAIDECLRSTSHSHVFASGDCAGWRTPLPKAGVHAVRMGPVLARNLKAALGAGSWRSHTPRRRHLALLSTADGRAIAAWGPFAFEGRLAWRWKDFIDRRFLRRFSAAA